MSTEQTTPIARRLHIETITSADGTAIAFERTGSGPPLVLVYGNGDVHTFWELAGVRPALAEHCTVYVIERRGRGESGDAPAYKLEREVEDVLAVVDAIDEPVTLLGHSGGALYSLEAALRTDNLGKLIVYEPPIQVGDHELDVEEGVAEMTRLLDDGESPPFFKDATEAVNKTLPNSRIATFDGQQHMAMHTAPDQFIDDPVSRRRPERSRGDGPRPQIRRSTQRDFFRMDDIPAEERVGHGSLRPGCTLS